MLVMISNRLTQERKKLRCRNSRREDRAQCAVAGLCVCVWMDVSHCKPRGQIVVISASTDGSRLGGNSRGRRRMFSLIEVDKDKQ